MFLIRVPPDLRAFANRLVDVFPKFFRDKTPSDFGAGRIFFIGRDYLILRDNFCPIWTQLNVVDAIGISRVRS